MKIRTKLVLMEMVSLLVLAVVLVASSLKVTIEELENRIEETLQVAVEGYSGDVNYLRNLGTDIDITVFLGVKCTPCQGHSDNAFPSLIPYS